MKYIPHAYQEHAYKFGLKNTHCGLFLDMGLGKTVTTLSIIDSLMYDSLEIAKVLIIGPKRVAESVWSEEINKWDHLKHLRISKVLGSEKVRLQALRADADIYVINRENVTWLCSHYGGLKLPFDMLVIDELSSFKSPKSQRFKALRAVRGGFKRIIGLTGTPAPNGLIDLWSQVYLLDGGERLFKTITRFRETFFRPQVSKGAIVYKYALQEGAADRIQEKIGDICISMKTEDYLELPEAIHNYIELNLPEEIMSQYKEFEKEQILSFIDSGIELTAQHAAALTNKLLQFSNGAVYYEGTGVRDYIEIHDVKLKALEEVIELANGKPVLIAYQFQHDRERIIRALRTYNIRWLQTDQDIKDWNDGKIQVMITHPASAGHGLNLQFGGYINCWYGETWNLELYDQFNKRTHRQGQKNNVIYNHFPIKGTEDYRVIKALESKGNVQNTLMGSIAARVEEYKKLFRC